MAALQRLDAGAMYFWMRDLTQEFLKLSIIYSSVEIFDKARLRLVPCSPRPARASASAALPLASLRPAASARVLLLRQVELCSWCTEAAVRIAIRCLFQISAPLGVDALEALSPFCYIHIGDGLQKLELNPIRLLPPQILGSFGVDTLEALSSTCTLYAIGDRQRCAGPLGFR